MQDALFANLLAEPLRSKHALQLLTYLRGRQPHRRLQRLQLVLDAQPHRPALEEAEGGGDVDHQLPNKVGRASVWWWCLGVGGWGGGHGHAGGGEACHASGGFQAMACLAGNTAPAGWHGMLGITPFVPPQQSG